MIDEGLIWTTKSRRGIWCWLSFYEDYLMVLKGHERQDPIARQNQPVAAEFEGEEKADTDRDASVVGLFYQALLLQTF